MKAARRILYPLLLAALVFGLTAAAVAGERQIERKDVPEAVLAAFAKAYPKADIKGYSTEEEKGQVVYEIESVEGMVMRDVTYATDGSVVSLEETLDKKALPRGVKSALNKKFPKAKVLKAERITKGTDVSYEFQLEDHGTKLEVVFDAQGNELERTAKTDEEG